MSLKYVSWLITSITLGMSFQVSHAAKSPFDTSYISHPTPVQQSNCLKRMQEEIRQYRANTMVAQELETVRKFNTKIEKWKRYATHQCKHDAQIAIRLESFMQSEP